MYSGKLARIHRSLASAPLLERDYEYPDEAGPLVWKKPFQKKKKKPFERITRVESQSVLYRRSEMTAKIASGELVRAKRATGGNWGVEPAIREKRGVTINGLTWKKGK